MVFPPTAFSPGQHKGKAPSPRPLPIHTARPSRSPLTAGAASYLVSHRGCLHFRIRVPDDLRPCLGRSELRRSLQTPSLRQARPRAMKLAVVAHLIFTLLRERLAMLSGGEDKLGQGWRGFDLEALTRLSDERIRELVNSWLDRALADEWESWLLKEHLPKDPGEMRDIMAGLYADTMEALEAHDYQRIAGEVAGVLREAGLAEADQVNQAGPGTSGHEDLERVARLQYLKLADALLLARAAVLEASSSPSFRGELVPNPSLNASAVRQLQEAGLAQPFGPMPPTAQGQPQPVAGALRGGISHAPADGPSLSEAVETYIRVKSSEKWGPVSQVDLPPQIRQFAAIIRDVAAGGEDLPLVDITTDHIRAYCATMRAQPRESKSPEYKGRSYVELAGLGLPPGECLSARTLRKLFTNVITFIKWAGGEYRIDAAWLKNAFAMPKVQKKRARAGEAERDRFSIDELRTIFNPGSYLETTAKHPSRFWGPLIALFTGMRRGEICQLSLSDLRQETDRDELAGVGSREPVWVFDVTAQGEQQRVKTDAGKRLVPIHPFLIDGLGLLDYRDWVVRENPQTRQLFPEVRFHPKHGWGNPVGEWFTRYRRELGIGAKAGERSQKVFHSFRHTVIHHLVRIALANTQLVQAVVGHEEKGGDIGVTARYAGEYPVATLRDDVILKLTWDQDIPALAELAASPWARGKRPGTKP